MYVMIPFDELHIEIGGVFVGIFEGVAEVDFDARILGITLDGWDRFQRGAKRKRTHLPIVEHPAATWDELFAKVLATEIYKQFGADITGAIADRVSELRTAFRDPGPSQHQRL